MDYIRIREKCASKLTALGQEILLNAVCQLIFFNYLILSNLYSNSLLITCVNVQRQQLSVCSPMTVNGTNWNDK